MITSTANKRVKELAELGAKARARNKADVFIVEGRKMFLEAPEKNIDSIYIEETFLGQAPEEVKTKLKQLPYEVVSADVFQKISDTKTPQGILCVMRQFHYGMEDILKSGAFSIPEKQQPRDKAESAEKSVPQAAGEGRTPLLMLLEDIQDPGNLGTIIRTSEGAGVTGVIMTRNTVDIYNPKTIRATMGSIYRVPFLTTEDLEETMQQLQQQEVEIYAAHLKGTSFYDAFDYRKPTAFLIGNEGNGLQEATAKAADTYVKIPMEGQVESLNAAIAATLFMYEANRQRRERQVHI